MQMSRTALVVAGIVAVAPGVARAVPAAELVSEGSEPVLIEKERGLEIEIDGVLARVSERARIASQRGGSFEAVYRFALPAEAAVTELSVKLPGGRVAKGILVGSDAAAAGIDDPEALKAKPDVALLRRIEWAEPDDETADLTRYELRLYPVDTKGVEARIRWVTPVRYTGGRLSVRVPGRGTATRFADAAVSLEVTAPSGAGGLTEIVGNGARLAKNVGASKGRYKFEAPAARDVIVETVPWFGESQQVWSAFATASVDETSGIVLVALLAPPAKAAEIPRFERVLFLIDVSRSMGSSGLVAARDLATRVMEQVGKQTHVEAVLFDNTARRVFGKWVDNDRDAEQKLTSALTIAQPANGSDLGAALDLVGPMIEETRRGRRDQVNGLGAATLLVVLSDAVTPLALDADRAMDRLGDAAADEVYVAGITIYPEDGDAPDAAATTVGAFATRAGGRALVVRDVDASAVAKQLAGDLTKPIPLARPTLSVGAAYLDDLHLPPVLEPGQGVVAVARYQGVLPKDMTVEAFRGAEPVTVTLSPGSVEIGRAVLPLWATRARVEDFIPPADAGSVEGSDAWDEAERRFVQLADQAHTVTAYSSLAALDPDDSFGRDRVSYVEKWGAALFQRLPPPPEREPGHAIKVEHPEPPAVAAEAGGLPQTRSSWVIASGSLDKAIIRRLVRTYVIPKAKACYDRALRADDKLTGSIELVLELSRGEVATARVERSTFAGRELDQCVAEAAYTMDVPRVAGASREVINVVRYPLTFVVEGARGEVKDDGTPPPQPAPDPNDPLEGLER